MIYVATLFIIFINCLTEFILPFFRLFIYCRWNWRYIPKHPGWLWWWRKKWCHNDGRKL